MRPLIILSGISFSAPLVDFLNILVRDIKRNSTRKRNRISSKSAVSRSRSVNGRKRGGRS